MNHTASIATYTVVVLVLLLFVQVSDAAFYTSKSGVQSLTSKNFDSSVFGGGRHRNMPWIVEFYAPWCGHCQKLKPEYIKLAGKLKGIVNIGAIDCDDKSNSAIAGRFGIKGFPTLKVFKPGSSIPIDYNGPRTAGDMANFVLKYLPNNVQTLKSQEDIDSFAEKGGVLLFTNKKKTTPLFKSLSARFEGRIDFGEIRNPDNDLKSRFGIENLPTLLLVDSDDFKTYDQKYSSEDLYDWIDPFAGPIPSSTKQQKAKKKSPPTRNFNVKLTEQNFDDLVTNSNEPWMVEFYAPWCGHCQKLAPEWKKAANSWKGIVNYGAIDATEETALAQRFGVQGYPTIKAFPGRREGTDRETLDYNYQRTAQALSQFSSQLLPDLTNHWVSGKDCITLFTKKNTTPDMMKALALRFQDREVCVDSSSNTNRLSDATNGAVSSLPAIVVFNNGQTKVYDGQLNFDSISQLVLELSGDVPAPTQGLIEIENNDLFLKECKEKLGLCIVAFPVLETGVAWGSSQDTAENKRLYELLSSVEENERSTGKYRFLWASRLQNPALVQEFRLPEDGSLGLIILQGRKHRYTNFIGSLSESNIHDFLENVLRGRIRTSKYDGSIEFSDGKSDVHDEL